MIRKNFFVLTVLLFSTIIFLSKSYSQSETKKSPEEMATKMADRMKTNLSLSDDQYKQVYDLFLTHCKDKISNKEKFKDMSKESRKQMKKQGKENFRKQLGNILTPDQLSKWNEMKGKHKNKDRKNKMRKLK